MISVQQKWNHIYNDKIVSEVCAAEVLLQNQHLLPVQGRALDLACGFGGNSLLMARQGLDVAAWDISSVAIERLNQDATRQFLNITTEVRDVIAAPPEPEMFDVIVVTHFLAREMNDQLIAALKPGGLLFYQTYCRNKVFNIGPNNPDFLLKDNELLDLFAGLTLRVYREESLLGNLTEGWRNQAMFIGQKKFDDN